MLAAAASSEEQQHRSLSGILLLLKQQYSTAQGTNVAADADSTILMLVLLKNFCCCFSSNDYILLRDNDTSMAPQLELVQYCRRICWTNGFSQLHILHITLAYSAHFTSNILFSPILPLIYFLSRLLPILLTLLQCLSYTASPTMPLLRCLSRLVAILHTRLSSLLLLTDEQEQGRLEPATCYPAILLPSLDMLTFREFYPKPIIAVS